MREHLTLGVGGPATVQPAAAQRRLERRALLPQLVLGGAHVVVAVDEHGRRARRRAPLGPHRRGRPGRPQTRRSGTRDRAGAPASQSADRRMSISCSGGPATDGCGPTRPARRSARRGEPSASSAPPPGSSSALMPARPARPPARRRTRGCRPVAGPARGGSAQRPPPPRPAPARRSAAAGAAAVRCSAATSRQAADDRQPVGAAVDGRDRVLGPALHLRRRQVRRVGEHRREPLARAHRGLQRLHPHLHPVARARRAARWRGRTRPRPDRPPPAPGRDRRAPPRPGRCARRRRTARGAGPGPAAAASSAAQALCASVHGRGRQHPLVVVDRERDRSGRTAPASAAGRFSARASGYHDRSANHAHLQSSGTSMLLPDPAAP